MGQPKTTGGRCSAEPYGSTNLRFRSVRRVFSMWLAMNDVPAFKGNVKTIRTDVLVDRAAEDLYPTWEKNRDKSGLSASAEASVRDMVKGDAATTDTMLFVEIYADGGSEPNPDPGGYGAVLLHPKKRASVGRGLRLTTDEKGEILATSEGVNVLDKSIARFQ